MKSLQKRASCFGGMRKSIYWMLPVDEAGILTPSFIVLEPDYLLDISSLGRVFP